MGNTSKFLTHDEALTLYKALLLPRLIEEKMLKLLRQNKIAKWFSGIGQEAIAVGVTISCTDDDYILPMHRNLGVFTTRQVDMYKLFCQLFGKKDGFTGGRERSFHFGIHEKNIVGMISHLGATMPVADGLALAKKLKGEKALAVSFCGDGATSEGDFHEALNLAAVWQLPVIFVIENNGYGLSTPVQEQYACAQLVDKAIGYGIHGFKVDGNDILAVLDVMQQARELALSGKPVFIEAMTFRMRGHEEASGVAYVPPHLFEEWAKKDPILRYEAVLKSDYDFTDEQFNELKKELQHSFLKDIDRALISEEPVADNERELSNVFSLQAPEVEKFKFQARFTEPQRFVDGCSMALRHAMHVDDRVLQLGQDIAEYGGVFKITENFYKEFGKDRVRNTPIIESGAVGAAIGLAVEGFKPVLEMQFADFISCGFNQIINNLAKMHYRWSNGLNVTIRCPSGAGVGAGPFHSQSPEHWFMQHAGLKVVVPSSVYDAVALTLGAIADPNPVMIFEHKKLYRSLKEELPDTILPEIPGKAKVKRSGSDASIITYGMGVHWALELAEDMASYGYDIEVLDLRSLSPLDTEAILTTVYKTGRVLLLQEPSEIMGPMSEVSAIIAEKAFKYLDAPVMRCSSIDTPIPTNKILEESYLPVGRLKAKMEALLAY